MWQGVPKDFFKICEQQLKCVNVILQMCTVCDVEEYSMRLEIYGLRERSSEEFAHVYASWCVNPLQCALTTKCLVFVQVDTTPTKIYII